MRITGHEFDTGQTARHQAAQERMPERTILTRSDIEPEDLTLSVLVDADGDDDRHTDDAVLLPDLHKGRIQLHIGVRAIEFARAKALYLRVQCLAQPADLALRDAAHAKRLDQVVHAPRSNAVDIPLFDHGNQRPLTAAAWLQHCRVIATVANTRDPQFDTANARVPTPVAIPVPFTAPSSRALVLVSADVLDNLGFHQLLRHQPDALTQKIHVLVKLGLAQQLEK